MITLSEKQKVVMAVQEAAEVAARKEARKLPALLERVKSRTWEEENANFLYSLSEEEVILYFMTCRVKYLLHQVGRPVDMSAPEVYSIDQIRDLVMSCIDAKYTTDYLGKIEEKKVGPFNRVLRFREFYEVGLIDKATLGYLACVNAWCVDKCLEAIPAGK